MVIAMYENVQYNGHHQTNSLPLVLFITAYQTSRDSQDEAQNKKHANNQTI